VTTRTCKQCERPFEPKRPHQIYDTRECRYQGWIENEVEAASQRVEQQPLQEVRGQQEEGGASADYLILAREQIARTLLHTGWFTADDLEPLGIPQQYRRSVHGSATGYFSGELSHMEEAGRRKSERPARKGGKNTVFRITVRGRRELPRLLKDMEGPVRDAAKRLYGDSLVGVNAGVPSPQGTEGVKPFPRSSASIDSDETSTQTGKGSAHPYGATLDRPVSSSHGDSPAGAREYDAVAGEQGSSAETKPTNRQLPAEEPAAQTLSLLPEPEQRPLSPVTDAEAA
jgi:hypothetical protein